MKQYSIAAICLSACMFMSACTPAVNNTNSATPTAAIIAQKETEVSVNELEPEAEEDSTFSMVPDDASAHKAKGTEGGRRQSPGGGKSAGKATDGEKAKNERPSSGKREKPTDGEKKSSGKKSESQTDNTASYDTSAQNAAAVLNDGDDLIGGTYTATGTDESAIEASGNVTATITGAVIDKASGDASSADASSFQGVNAGVRVYGNANVTLTDCTITATAQNATGVFAYENGTVTLYDCTVNVTGGGAGGVQVAGGGTLYGYNLNVTSASKAAIRSDRGGGTLVIDGGTYTSTGSNGCPAIYSTADITVKNADCVSTNSRAVIIEGKNTVTLENVTISGNDQSTKEGSVKANVLLYQSASGDASVGTSVFTMTGGSMKANTGAMFYCTNTASVINLESAELLLSDDGTLLIVSAGRWGKDGKNGGACTLNTKAQTLTGDIYVDAISSLALNLSDGSTYTGAITGEGSIAVTLDSTSTWTLTGDSYITSFDGDLSQIVLTGYTLYINGVAYNG